MNDGLSLGGLKAHGAVDLKLLSIPPPRFLTRVPRRATWDPHPRHQQQRSAVRGLFLRGVSATQPRLH